MYKNKYGTDYSALYPNVVISDDVMKVLTKSDRKMKYMEYDLKWERAVRDTDGAVTDILPGREDSYDRLVEVDKQFATDAPSPEEIFFYARDIQELRSCLLLLDEREQMLIEALFFEGCTERECAAELGLSQTRVHQLRKRALKKLKYFFK